MDWQVEAEAALRRFTVLLMHRRAGKTVFNAIRAITTALEKDKKIAYYGPSRDQVKSTIWDYLKFYLDDLRMHGLVTFNETDLTVYFKVTNSWIYLLSYENYDSRRGMRLDLAIMDEFQLAPMGLFDYVVSPMLIDSAGHAIFTGTPAGRNQLWEKVKLARELSKDPDSSWAIFERNWDETTHISEEEKAEQRRSKSEEAIRQEFYNDFDAAVKGTYYGKNIARARVEKRIMTMAYDPAYQVVTGWDIGFDGTVIWYCQNINGQIRLIDCDIFEGKDIPHTAKEVLSKDYIYAYHILPHDAAGRSVTDSKSPAGVMKSLGLKVKIAPHPRKISRDQGIHITRNLIDRAIISDRCERSIKLGKGSVSSVDLLALYRAPFDPDNDVQGKEPIHNRSSHVADALRTLAIGLKSTGVNAPIIEPDLMRNKLYVRKVVNREWDPLGERSWEY